MDSQAEHLVAVVLAQLCIGARGRPLLWNRRHPIERRKLRLERRCGHGAGDAEDSAHEHRRWYHAHIREVVEREQALAAHERGECGNILFRRRLERIPAGVLAADVSCSPDKWLRTPWYRAMGRRCEGNRACATGANASIRARMATMLSCALFSIAAGVMSDWSA
jgi:hypothetical protein